NITLLLLSLFLTNFGFSQSSAERAAIKNFCGCFEVKFKYAETFAHAENYEFHKPYQASALELVTMVEESPTKMVMQHILVINDSFFIKHWREDWEYQTDHLFSFQGKETWEMALMTSEQSAGQWSQEVYGVYDEPRYSGTATWFLADGKSVWVNTADAPLPRREYKKRKDYQVMRRTNSLHIKDWGWIHEQDNEKVLVKADGSEEIIVEEKGKNTYTRVDDRRCQKGLEWWKNNQKNWKAVRTVWDEVLMEPGTYKIEKRHEDGDYLPRKMKKFAKMDFTTEMEAQEKVREIIQKHRSAVEVQALAEAGNIFHDRSFWKTAPSVELVKQKIEEGHDPVAMTPYAFDAITYAILENVPIETVQFLLTLKGNEVNKRTHDGRNYLMWAAYKGNVALSKFLISEGSKTDIIDDHGYNLITFTAVAGQTDPEMYNLILANGGNAQETNRAGANALLLLAPHLKDDQMIQYFQEKGVDIHAKDNDGNGMFNYAARMGNVEMMEKLIEMGLEYQNLNKVGGNAVTMASRGFRRHTNSLSVYQFLEAKGIATNVVTQEGRTPLHSIAYRSKDYAIFEYFINKGVDINKVDQEGNTAFLNAVYGRNFEMAQKIAPMVQDFNHQNKEGHSALTYALKRNATDFVDFLMTKSVSPTIKDQEGNNLAYHVFDAYREKSGEAFEKHVALLQGNGVDFAAKQSKGNNILHLAVEKGQSFLVEKAIQLGVKVNDKNEDGLTPLHLAAMKAVDSDLLHLLLQHGADKSITTAFEESAFDLASENELLQKEQVNIEFLK
ncbi:MAG: DUF6607 family protein, partial [Bacteroidota bacterium]